MKSFFENVIFERSLQTTIKYLMQRESMKLKGSVKKGKKEPSDHHQTRHSPNSLALFATDSLGLKLADTAINEHTNTHKRLTFRI